MTESLTCVIDPQTAGISGDMLTSALVDAGADKAKVIESIFACQNFVPKSSIKKAEFEFVNSHGFQATRLKLSCSDRVHERNAVEMYRALGRICESLPLEQRAKVFALESFKTIALAEAKIHGENFSTVHLHEASSIDTFADIIGCATALQDLGLFHAKVFSTRVAVGGGMLTFSHGTIPNPAAAILEIFRAKSFGIFGGQADSELTTPTGAALLVNIAGGGSTSAFPEMSIEKIGYGAGTKEFEAFPNVLRVVMGKGPALQSRDSVTLIETNIDDASGEIIGNLVDRISGAGAKDIAVLQGISKKNRPTYLVRIISDQAQVSDMLEILFSESGTLGARVSEVQRVILPRAKLVVQVKIEDQIFAVNVKVVRDAGGLFRSAKAEFEDIKSIAAKLRMPARRVAELVHMQILQKTGGEFTGN
ncbi:MAG: nickel pincer cofactor biosynthesis protein LarC [Nitrososphaera sp.]|jgi:uncharacterized protein (TIGR00299 family) protein